MNIWIFQVKIKFEEIWRSNKFFSILQHICNKKWKNLYFKHNYVNCYNILLDNFLFYYLLMFTRVYFHFANISTFLHNSHKSCRFDFVAIKFNSWYIIFNWLFAILYFSCVIYSAITTVSQWLHTQGCDYSF